MRIAVIFAAALLALTIVGCSGTPQAANDQPLANRVRSELETAGVAAVLDEVTANTNGAITVHLTVTKDGIGDDAKATDAMKGMSDYLFKADKQVKSVTVYDSNNMLIGKTFVRPAYVGEPTPALMP